MREGIVDFRRFRTWDAEPARTTTPAWRILARYGYVRLTSSWAGIVLLILLAIAAVVAVGGFSYAFASGAGVHARTLSGAAGFYAYPMWAILLLVAGPLFADDLRFNAPLFYFSKPVRVGDYVAGKLAYLGSLVAAGVLVPVFAILLTALLVGVPASKVPDFRYADPAEIPRAQAAWYATHIDSVGEWFAAAAALVPAILLSTALFTSLAVACSVFTRRGWHAGMALVAVVGGTGIAGGVLADATDGAAAHLWSPMGWAYLMISVPIELMFHVEPMSRGTARQLEGASLAIPVAYLLSAAATAGLLWLSVWRLRRQEGML